MNAGDNLLQERGEYDHAGSFPISNLLTPMLLIFQIMSLYYF